MADVKAATGEFSDVERSVDIVGDESSLIISVLNQKIADLEREKGKNILENEGYVKQLEELESSIEELNSENTELKKQLDRAESDCRALQSAAARAAMLEGEVSRLQHDLPSLDHDRRENIRELAEMKKELDRVKERHKEKGVKLEAVLKERELLRKEVEKLEGVVRSFRENLDGMDQEKSGLIKIVEEVEVELERNKNLEKAKDELEETVKRMKAQISALKSSGVNRDVCENKESAGGSKGNNWGVVIGGSTVAAIAVMGVTHFVHAARKC